MPVNNETMLLINASEVLARDGIHGKIAQIGVGFGTGRHTAKRNSSVPPIRVKSALARSASPPARNDRAVSAHSYRSPIKMSIALSPRSMQSLREKNEQVTQGRFEPD
jgi:ribosomal protein S28E/S33